MGLSMRASSRGVISTERVSTSKRHEKRASKLLKSIVGRNRFRLLEEKTTNMLAFTCLHTPVALVNRGVPDAAINLQKSSYRVNNIPKK